MHIVLVKLPVAILTRQQLCVKCYYSQSSFRTPPVPSVFEDSPVYRLAVSRFSQFSGIDTVFTSRHVTAATAENEPCKVCPLSAYRSPRFDPSPAPLARESTGKRVGKLYIMDDTDSAGGPDSASFIESGVQLPAPTRYDKIR